MKKKNKGFTLIELLAVIVILGLLMAIAIPSVTKYITQSRKKTLVSTINNYIGALVNDVNDMQYSFTDTNTIYAVPIECIALEKGGTDPFGDWYPATSEHWAYVLVQPNGDGYTYGFTFKDSAGYGLRGVSQQKLDEKGSQIQTGLGLSKPTSSQLSNVTWEGFKNLSKLSVLFAATSGDGKTTCTVQRDDVEVEETEAALYFGKPYVDSGDYAFIYYEDGSTETYDLANGCEFLGSKPAGYYTYADGKIIRTSSNQVMYVISADKKSYYEESAPELYSILNEDENWCQ